jgi:cysteine desulfurase
VVYLDHNATTPVRAEVSEAMLRATADLPGNPSSIHGAGRRARDAVERAREQTARLLGVTREEIVFTSGGTEGDNLAIRGLAAGAAARGRRHVISSPLEHPAVRGALVAAGRAEPGMSTTILRVSGHGEIQIEDLEAALRDDTGLVTLSCANHELGNLYPINRFSAAARARGALMHTDAVQAAGKVALDLSAWGVDAATLSAHKLGGPKGVGAVFVRRGLDLPPLFLGGHQERERRPGTENVAGIVGFGVACEIAAAELVSEGARVAELARELRRGLSGLAGSRFFGVKLGTDGGTDGSTAGGTAVEKADALPGTIMVAFSGAPGQLVAIGLDLEGVCVSTGAACSSGSLEPSPVLTALGLSPIEAGEGLRISLGWTTTRADVARVRDILPRIIERVRGAVSLTDAVPNAPAVAEIQWGGRT